MGVVLMRKSLQGAIGDARLNTAGTYQLTALAAAMEEEAHE